MLKLLVILYINYCNHAVQHYLVSEQSLRPNTVQLMSHDVT